VVWAAFTVTFLILFALPGDAVTQTLAVSDYIPPEQLEALRNYYGLDRPLHEQYLHQLWGLAHGDLGMSISTGMPVAQSLRIAFPQTLALASLALAFSLIAGPAIAMIATLTRRPLVRRLACSLPAIGTSVPGFWIGLTLLGAFSFALPIFPAFGNDGLASLVLPAVTLSVYTSAVIAQLLLRGLDHEWQAAYVETARAKGLGPYAIQLRHVLRNAVLPVATSVAMTIGNLLAGTVIAETIFARNGIGRLTQVAVTNQDMAVVQGVVVVSAVVYATVNLAVDLLYPVLDPRIRMRWRAAT
jgi:peptide/nickel transport system permease protein